MDSTQIANFELNDYVACTAAVLSIARRSDRMGRERLTLRIGDKTGSIDAVKFGVDECDLVIQKDDVVRTKGTVGQYNDQPQIVLDAIVKLKPGQYDIADLLPSSKRDIEEMWEELEGHLDNFSDERLARLLRGMISDNKEALCRSAAGMRIHHCFVGGLLEHITSMLSAADYMCVHYSQLNRDWLHAGVILHDIGKIEEMSINTAIQYTTPGTLTGHVTVGILMLEKYAAKIEGFPEELKFVLRHLILSHHGEQEHGALVVPMFPEALALNLIDRMDAGLEQFFRLMDAGSGVWTDYIPNLGRKILRARTNENWEAVATVVEEDKSEQLSIAGPEVPQENLFEK